MKLNELAPAAGSTRNRKRIGRGPGSGTGTFSGRGCKGQNSRSGGGVRPGYEGGQMPIHRRLPKRGFTNIFRNTIVAINIRDLERFEKDTVIDAATLVQARIVKGAFDGIKLLGNGDIQKSLTIRLNAISKSAREKIEAAGGTVEVR